MRLFSEERGLKDIVCLEDFRQIGTLAVYVVIDGIFTTILLSVIFVLTFASCCKVSSRINSIYFFLSALWIAITQYSDNTISCSYMEVNQGSISLTLSLWQTQWNIIEDLNRGNISSIFSSISEANASELLESILRHLVWNFLEILKKMSPKYW